MSISLSRATEFISGSSDTVHPFTFEWQDKEHVKVYLNGVALTQDDGTSNLNFSISGTPGAANVVLGSAISIALGDVLVIQRETPQTYANSPVQWTPGPFKSSDLESSTKHQLYLTQEALREALDLGDRVVFDGSLTGGVDVDAAAVNTAAAFTSASALETDPDGGTSQALYFQSPTGYIISTAGVRFLQAGTYLVDMEFQCVSSTSGLVARIGFGTQKAPKTQTLPGSSVTASVHQTFQVVVTAPVTLRPYAALASGTATQSRVVLKVSRVT